MRPFALSAAMLCALLALPGGARAADAQRGRVLYETGCSGCHDVSVHGRPSREARDFGELRAWVRRWSANVRLKWSDAEVDDVAVHLNETYYGFRCPPAYCTATGAAGAGGRLALDAIAR